MANPLLIALTAACVGAAAAYLGSFMVLRRMSLVGDALSHVALPGMAIALTFGLSPLLGAFTALVIAVIGIWYLQTHTTLQPESLVGIFFTTSLALGILITPQAELLESLFGDLAKITTIESLIAILISLLTISVTALISKKLILSTISADLAHSTGVSNSLTNLLYYLLIGLIIALGIRFSGTLLVGALVIIPAVSAQNLSRSLTLYYILSLFFGLSSALFGTLLSSSLNLPPGPIIVLFSAALFLLTFIIRLLHPATPSHSD